MSASAADLQDELIQALLRLAKGDFSVRLPRNYKRDTTDTLAYFVNLIAEELARLLAERERDHTALSSAVEQLTEQFLAFAAGDFSVRAPRSYKSDPIDVLAYLFNNTASEVEDAFREIRLQHGVVEAILESMIESVMLLDARGQILRANHATGRLLGHEPSALIGRSLSELLAPSERDLASVLIASIGEQTLQGRETSFLTAAGEPLTLSVNASAQRDADGTLAGIVLVARDDRELRHAQAQLQMMDRLATMGTVAAGVAHEINNPLAFVLANLEFVQGEVERTPTAFDPALREEIQRALRDSRDGAERMRDIVRELKSYARSSSDNVAPIEVSKLADASLRMIRNEVRHRARLVVKHEPAPLVVANEGRLVQVVINLVQNAAHAIPAGRASANEIRVTTGSTGAGEAFIEVRDTGGGIRPEHRARIFEAFFTTKPGVGTGLGLAICQQIVRSSHGRIEVESEVGVGSTLRVVLPAAQRAAPATATLHRLEKIHAPPKRRVLVVDDEPAIGASVRRLLADDLVDFVTSGDAALERMARNTYDVVLCDVHMPESSGPQLFADIMARMPELASRFVFMTGGEISSGGREDVEHIARPVIDKPFTGELLREVIAGVMAASAVR
jgi:two-component system, NtrC family, sensor kinase